MKQVSSAPSRTLTGSLSDHLLYGFLDLAEEKSHPGENTFTHFCLTFGRGITFHKSKRPILIFKYASTVLAADSHLCGQTMYKMADYMMTEPSLRFVVCGACGRSQRKASKRKSPRSGTRGAFIVHPPANEVTSGYSPTVYKKRMKKACIRISTSADALNRGFGLTPIEALRKHLEFLEKARKCEAG